MSKRNIAGITGLEGREPIGAAVTIGVKKGGSGYPTETDRWHIVQPREEAGVRPLHPAFAAFNGAPPEKRKVLRGNLVHASRSQCFEYQLKNQSNKQIGMHPDRRPFCVGDGVHAQRWSGDGPDDFLEIKCPHDRCEFRLTTPPQCKPWARLLFRLRWPDGNPLDTPLVKFTTGSWYTVGNLYGERLDQETGRIIKSGLLGYLETVAGELGLEQYSLFGFPFLLTLTRQTKRSHKTAFPVVTFSPEIDPVEFFLLQRKNIRSLQQQCEALTDQAQQEPGLVYDDVKQITAPSKGGA